MSDSCLIYLMTWESASFSEAFFGSFKMWSCPWGGIQVKLKLATEKKKTLIKFGVACFAWICGQTSEDFGVFAYETFAINWQVFNATFTNCWTPFAFRKHLLAKTLAHLSVHTFNITSTTSILDFVWKVNSKMTTADSKSSHCGKWLKAWFTLERLIYCCFFSGYFFHLATWR